MEVFRFDPPPDLRPQASARTEQVMGAVLKPAPGAHAVEGIAGAHADALDGGTLGAYWATAVLTQPKVRRPQRLQGLKPPS
jgi:hypothetical protein